MMLYLRSKIAKQFHEMMLDDSDDMEAIGDDFRIGESSFDQSAVGGT